LYRLEVSDTVHLFSMDERRCIKLVFLSSICIGYVWCNQILPDWIYFSITRTPTFLRSELGGRTLVWSVSYYHLLELSKCIPQDAWIMVISLNKLCLHHLRFWKGRKLLIAKCSEGGYETTMALWTHSNQQAAPITVHISIYYPSYIEELMTVWCTGNDQILNDCFMQLWTPWWWASEAWNT
jgi:hypothetical protein